ncbi:extracellular solute-binding protein [Rhodovulum sp. YNF3179]|uniref:extracellular solute-binding protein n=1 Tax=Rhodovulum sp. YNF3179 TaxID=3425127 RepID=UPI003D32A811
MSWTGRTRRVLAAAAAAGLVLASAATAEPRHGIAMYGAPALPPDFVSLPYANPDAPKGGRIVFGEAGGFDSLNPWIVKGRAPWGVRAHMYETLMGRSWDEPFTLYGLLAESVETGPNREWVAFTLRAEAAFSDGTPVTVEDVMWSFETLGTAGHPRYHAAWSKIAGMEQTGPRTLRITFNSIDRELPLILGLRPILKKAQWADRPFDESSLEVPIASGPYVVADFEPGRFLSLKRDPQYWGRDLPFNRGRHNLDEIRYEYFGDGSVVFEAFKAGAVTSYREWNAAKWESAYDFPAIADGRIVKSEIPHQRPTGISGFVMNTRRDVFADWRVRAAMIHAFNFEFINQTLNGGTQPRIQSYFDNSVLGMRPGPAEGRVRALLAPYADTLPPGALDGYSLPVSDGTERNRGNLRKAVRLLAEAGWTVQDGVLKDADGAPFRFEILLKVGAQENQSIIDIYTRALARLGIEPQVSTVDDAQYTERTNLYDFDMAYYRRGLSLSPGNEQRLYWGSEGVEKPGTRNWMGIGSPAADAMIDRLLSSESREDFVAAVRALDRILMSGRYVIPIWYSNISRLAHSARLKYPDTLPMYGDWIGFQPDVWWYEEE